jgi:glucose uptake protein GlcU
MWAIGGAGGIFATSGLGNAVGFPLVLNMSFLVNSSWSILYFKEIQGKKNLQYFGGAFLLIIGSTVLIALSKGS